MEPECQDALVKLNVGGQQFTTSKNTLTWIPDSFFTSLLSGRIPTLKDETGAIFIDRDPKLFQVILKYLRSRQVDLHDTDSITLKHEAQFYGLTPLHHSPCGDLLFHGYLMPPVLPQSSSDDSDKSSTVPCSSLSSSSAAPSKPLHSHVRNLSEPAAVLKLVAGQKTTTAPAPTSAISCNPQPPQPQTEPNIVLPTALSSVSNVAQMNNCPSEFGSRTCPQPHRFMCNDSESSTSAVTHWRTHRSCGSSDLTRQIRQEVLHSLKLQHDMSVDPQRVRMIRGHLNSIAVAYSYFVACYRLRENTGWSLFYVSPRCEAMVRMIALNSKFGASQTDRMLAAALSTNVIRLWSVTNNGEGTDVGRFSLNVSVDTLFFIGSQLVALSKTGKVGIWHGMTQNWQVQDVMPICSYDTAGSFLLLGCKNGSIYYIDMQKFPLRMKDNDLLVTELHKDPVGDAITAISVYLTPKSNLSGNWLEIAYGTSRGAVRVIVQHPETVGHSPQLFQSFTVHRARVTKVSLTASHLISVCSEYNHVRTWSLTRFRGMISTQPGSTPLASFKVLALESTDSPLDGENSAEVGPFGDKDSEQLFVQKVVPETSHLYVRLASTGERVCTIRSVDGSSIDCFLLHECEGSSGTGARCRRYLFTGHSNGCIQMFDLTTALEVFNLKAERSCQGPSVQELLHLISECEISYQNSTTNSHCSSFRSLLHLPGVDSSESNGH